MEMPPGAGELVDAYVSPFAEIAGDRRTGRLLGEVVRGIIGSESLICARIAAFSPPVGRGPL
jgi:hypothetical protein